MKNRTGLIATKIGNSSYFGENGKVIPVTLLRVDECIVSNIKTLEKEIGIKAKKKFLPMQKGDEHSTLSDTKLLQQITGYKTKTNYKLGIKKFVKWFKEFYS